MSIFCQYFMYSKISILRPPFNLPENGLISEVDLISNTVDSRYLEIEGTLKNTSRYPYFDISDL